MRIKRLNKILESYINEISDETKQSYLAKRQAQIDKAQSKMNKAKQMIAKSDKRVISNLPDRTDLDTAKKVLNALKLEMRKVDNGSNWRLEEQEDGKYISLEVRYWGEWEEHDEDDDWATLSDKYRKILDDILVKVQKEYKVKITEPGSEKKWLVFDIYLKQNQLENPKFGEWQENFDDEFYTISLYSDNPTIHIIIGSQGTSAPIVVTVRADDDKFYADEVFNHIPTIEEIEQFAESEYPNIKNWNIPNIPNELVSKWNMLIKDETFMNNIPHKFSKWEFGDQHGRRFISTSAKTAYTFNYEFGIMISKNDDSQYVMSFYGSEKLDREGEYLFKSVPTLHQIQLIINVGSDIDQDYGDVDFDSIPEIPKRLITKL